MDHHEKKFLSFLYHANDDGRRRDGVERELRDGGDSNGRVVQRLVLVVDQHEKHL